MESRAQPVELHCREKTGTAELAVGEKQAGKRDGKEGIPGSLSIPGVRLLL